MPKSLNALVDSSDSGRRVHPIGDITNRWTRAAGACFVTDWFGEGCFDSRRRVNSNVRHLALTIPMKFLIKLLAMAMVLLFALVASHFLIYRPLIVPRLPSLQAVPLLWWRVCSAANGLSCLWNRLEILARPNNLRNRCCVYSTSLWLRSVDLE